MSPSTDPEWSHLQRLIDTLIESGNPTLRGMQPNQGGFDCQMRDSLAADVVHAAVSTDPHASKIKFGEDKIECLHCWAGIYGPTARR